MRKIVKLLLVFVLSLSLFACESGPKAGTFTGSGTGYEGKEIEVTIKTDEKGEILSLEVTKNEEEGPGKTALEILPDKVVKYQSLDIDLVSGATITSKGFAEATIKALRKAGIDHKKMVKREYDPNPGAQVLEADIAIIGAGGAGLIAAIEAAIAGKKVIILEKNAGAGGNSVRSTGGMNAAKTSEQDQNIFESEDAFLKKIAVAKEKYPDLMPLIETVENQFKEYQEKKEGYFDSVELFALDTLVGGQNINDPDLVNTLVKLSAPAIEWLKTIGINLTSVGQFGGASVKRIHRPVDADGKTIAVGSYMIPILIQTALARGVKIIYEAPATSILYEDGEVKGVVAQGYTVNAKNVIIASGGFGGNLEMVAKIIPEYAGFVSTNAPGITGDGIEMAKAINAAVVDMDKIQLHPTVEAATGSLITEGLRGDGAILINKNGERFVNEVQTREVVAKAENSQPDGLAYLIIDNKMADASKVIQSYILKGFTKKGETYEELAKNIGVDSTKFKETMEKWNSAVKDKHDGEHDRRSFANPLDDGPFYAIEVKPGVHHTMGGIKINSKAEVIDVNGKVIPHLYAAGEVCGGVHGGNRLGGNAVTDFVVFGRIAGQNASLNN